MPASYAHYRFGKQALPDFPADVRQCIQRFRRMFDMGLYGPDIFFYHNQLTGDSVTALRGTFRSQTGQEFFTAACAQADSEAARAYLYGLLGHYCLNSACHPFLQAKVDSGEARHVALEAEFDRYLLEMDGLVPPHTQDFSHRMKLTRGECVTVAALYPSATPSGVSQSVRRMAMSTRFLAGKNRSRVEKLLKLTKKQELMDQLLPTEGDERFKRMDSELLARYNRALKQYPVLLEQLTAHLRTGQPLGEDFAPKFG